MDKNVKGLVDKAAWSLMQSSRDAVLVSVTQACKAKALDISPDQYKKLVLVVESAFEDGFNKGKRTFDKTVEQAMKSPEVVGAKKKTP
jgi:hypothetical protein